ncbi:NucA/NucB deoxyribonuclease domain-containing protein [Actinomadura chokoriensis]|uniref:NucA/NucB deoxyribonuclease domain-containing protein n=1 Tax=Actinomadura chokoriensis TaxID=454156 RepID=UPI003D15CD52
MPLHLLHRLTSAKGGENQERYNADSNANDRNCNAGTPPTPTPGSKDCDEFPFASTYEGAAAPERHQRIRRRRRAQPVLHQEDQLDAEPDRRTRPERLVQPGPDP